MCTASSRPAIRALRCLLGGVCLLSSFVPDAVRAQGNRTAVEVAAELAPSIARELLEVQEKQDRVLEVAVLPFGNETGHVPQQLYASSKTLQGELVAELRNLGQRRVLFWDPFQLKQAAAESKANLALLSAADYKQASEELEKLGLDAVVVGTFQDGSGFDNIHADILFREGAPLQAAVKGGSLDPTHEVEGGAWPISTRFSVEILVDGQPLPMSMARAGHALYVDLDRELHYGKHFTIRIRNHGQPPVGWIAKNRRHEDYRCFCAAVFVDGVSTIYEKAPDGEFHPVQRHPDHTRKWVLSPPGLRVRRGYDTERNPNLAPASGPGHSVRDIPGFQQNLETVRKFTFLDTGESLAHEVGITKDIGLISVYFYSEVAPDDVRYPGPGAYGAGPGVGLGPVASHKTFVVNVKLHDAPVELWNIYYRYRGDRDSMRGRRENGEQFVPIQAVRREMQQRLRQHDPFAFRREYDRFFRPGRGGNFGSTGPR